MSQNMLLAIDIGNTNISCGVFPAGKTRGRFYFSKLRSKRKIEPSPIKTFDLPTKQYSRNKLLKKIGSLKIADSLICSVVPGINKVIAKDLAWITGKKPYIIGKPSSCAQGLGKGVSVPIKNRYHNPKQTGQDRLVNAYAASIIYGAPVIVVSCGTAITTDVVAKDRSYLGGLIQPGLNLMLEALNFGTALLPKIGVGSIRSDPDFGVNNLIGKDTKSSILNGVILGTCAGIDQLTEKIKRLTGKNTRIIGTGGASKILRRFSKNIKHIDEELILKGMYLIYKNKIINKIS